MELALLGPDLRNIDLEIANRVALELVPFRFVTLNIWRTRNAMPLKATMRRRTGQVRDRRLLGIKTIVQRQQGVPPERHNHCFLIFAENS